MATKKTVVTVDQAHYNRATKALKGQLRPVEIPAATRVAMGRLLELLEGEDVRVSAPTFFKGARPEHLAPARVQVFRPYTPTGDEETDDLMLAVLGDDGGSGLEAVGIAWVKEDGRVSFNPAPKYGRPGWMDGERYVRLGSLSDAEVVDRFFGPPVE